MNLDDVQAIVALAEALKEPGRDGTDGRDGMTGRDGIPGVIGLVGPKGPKGDRGEAGRKGDKGDKGDKGEPGAAALPTPFTSNAGWMSGTGGGGSNVRLVDLGVILAADCSGGNSTDLQPLIGASVGDVVHLVVDGADFVQHDSNAQIAVIVQVTTIWTWQNTNTTGLQARSTGWVPYVEDGAALPLVGAGSLATVGAIHLKAVVTTT